MCGVGECGFGHLIVILYMVHKCGFVLVVSVGKLEGLKQMKVGLWYLCGFYELVGTVCGLVEGV